MSLSFFCVNKEPQCIRPMSMVYFLFTLSDVFFRLPLFLGLVVVVWGVLFSESPPPPLVFSYFLGRAILPLHFIPIA